MSDEAAEDWPTLLGRLNSSLLNAASWRDHVPAEARSAGWCGLPPASEEEILAAEKRLGVTLPPSYRSFLSFSNGWYPYSSFIRRLIPVQEIEWLRTEDPESARTVQLYPEDQLTDAEYRDYADGEHSNAMRPRYYPECLLIGKAWPSEGELLLLNPQVVLPDGEWEAIFFADWLPGNERFRSFRDLVSRDVDFFFMREGC